MNKYLNSFAISTQKLNGGIKGLTEECLGRSFIGYFPDHNKFKSSNECFYISFESMSNLPSEQNYIAIKDYEMSVVGSDMNTQAIYYICLPEKNCFVVFNDLLLAKNILESLELEVIYDLDKYAANLEFFKHINRLCAGEKIDIKNNGGQLVFNKTSFSDILLQNERELTIEQSKDSFYNVLFDSTNVLTKGVNDIYITLSGGIDSGTIAYILKELGKKVYAFTLGTDWSDEYEEAKQTADYLGIPLEKIHLSIGEITKEVPNVIRYFGFMNNVSIEIALVAFCLYKKITGNKKNNMLFASGYGSDLLNAGIFSPFDNYSQLAAEITANLRKTQVSNEFCNLSALDMGIMPVHPFWKTEVILEALKVPGKYKVVDGKDKYYFRSIMESKLPHSIAWRIKKGAHQGTGLTSYLCKAIEEEFKLRSKSEDTYKNIIKRYHKEIFC